jgi:aldehyde:ferredoxin oxidoreductase
MYGWHGRLLFIDLTRKTFYTEPLSDNRLQMTLGGRGLAVDLFHNYAELDPFSARTPLILTTGPLSGTGTVASERLCILSRSPLTKTIFDTSSGGTFAHSLKASGHDGLFIYGASDRPVALRIRPTGVDFLEADSLWGKTTSETVSAFPESAVAAIGPAGENRVRYANIVFSDGDNDGRGGLGAVMGSKKLKAIAVDGNCQTTIADPQKLLSAQQKIMRLLRASSAIMGPFGLHEYGTPTFIDLCNQRRMLPTNNFKSTYFDRSGMISGPAIRAALNPAHDSCYDCAIACKKIDKNRQRLPEYSPLSHFGGLLNNGDLGSVIDANTTCREFGIDAISAASTLATLMEITGDPVHPEELRDTLKQIGQRQCDTELLGLGSRLLAEELGHPESSMTVKSLELPAFDPRGATGMALSYCTSTLGGSQVRANMEASEILRKPVAIDRFSFSGKARLVKIAEDLHAAYDSLVVCPHAFYAASLEEYGEVLSSITGHDYSPATLAGIGEKIIQAERKINRRNGFSGSDDLLPERFFTQDGSCNESLSIPALNKAAFIEELHRYERIRNFTDL